jgi:hypothetical protein
MDQPAREVPGRWKTKWPDGHRIKLPGRRITIIEMLELLNMKPDTTEVFGQGVNIILELQQLSLGAGSSARS